MNDTLQLELPDFAFTGKAGAGKTTAADFLTEGAGYIRCSIAEPLKDMAASVWGPDARKDRGKLQKLGQTIREMDEDAWVNLMLRKLDTTRAMGNGTKATVDDLRFPNEYWRLKEQGFVVVRIEAPKALRIDRLRAIGKLQDESQLEDTSETALDDFEFDYTVTNDGPVEDFYQALRVVVLSERKRS